MNDIVNTRIELMFFDPQKSHDDYCIFFHSVRPVENDDAYSPLYNLRNEIYELTKNGHWLSAILLSHIVVDGLVSYFFNSNYEIFYNKYMNLSNKELIMHRIYRNAREHNFGQLLVHLNPGLENEKRWHKKVYDNFIETKNEIKKDRSAIIKVMFDLSVWYEKVAEDESPIYDEEKKYYKILFRLNPKLFIQKLEDASSRLKTHILKDMGMQQTIMQGLTEDNWMHIRYARTVTQLPDRRGN